MEDNKTLKIVRLAQKHGFAIPAVNCYSFEAMLAAVAAAEAERSPAMVQVFPWALHADSHASLAKAALLATRDSAWVSCHVDHVQSAADVRQCIALGFDSVMVDMSHASPSENLRLTRELAEEAHARGVAVEAEMGRIDGSEEGAVDAPALEALYTDPADALAFVHATEVDLLAPSVGNMHGAYPRSMPPSAAIQLDRLRRVHEAVGQTDCALVLHGYSDFTQQLTRSCIADGGVRKININKTIHESFKAHGRNFWADTAASGQNANMPRWIEQSIDAFIADIRAHMRLFGSSGMIPDAESTRQ